MFDCPSAKAQHSSFLLEDSQLSMEGSITSAAQYEKKKKCQAHLTLLHTQYIMKL